MRNTVEGIAAGFFNSQRDRGGSGALVSARFRLIGARNARHSVASRSSAPQGIDDLRAAAGGGMMGMPALTRCRSKDTPEESWRIFYGDVPVGWIGIRAGVPTGVDQWGWRCGFYPGIEPRQHQDGSVATLEAARVAFEEAWNSLLRQIPESAF